MCSIAGKPYDTLEEVIGICGEAGNGSLADFGVRYEQIELKDGKSFDFDAIEATLRREMSTGRPVKVIFIQRSKGYLNRKTLTVAEIDEVVDFVKSISPETYVVVDNCYGEFTEKTEPRADMLIGSLIKNPGGGMAETGGYIAGTKKAVELISYRLTTPGIGKEAGASLGQTKLMYKGLFYAPHTVCQALKTAVFAAKLFEKLGYNIGGLLCGVFEVVDPFVSSEIGIFFCNVRDLYAAVKRVSGGERVIALLVLCGEGKLPSVCAAYSEREPFLAF
jgi:cystathionine beta-lyase family protein involved in aluminum resistance